MSEQSIWYEKEGKDYDIVVSSRIRLARNLRGFPFVNRMTAEQKSQIADIVWDTIGKIDLGPGLRLSRINLDDISLEDSLQLAEKHLVSPDFARDTKGHVLLLSEDESLSIMLCEEDHIRIQVFSAGLQLEEAMRIADDVDNLLDERLDYAFDEKLGYLTECPTNLGTGLRASLMLHLPAIHSIGAINNVSSTVSKLGLTIRGTYGEESDVKGDFYQLSNQVTLGISESNAITNLIAIGKQIITQERNLRSKYEKINLEDRVFRSIGILQNARIITFDELCDRLSVVLVGISEGMMDEIKPSVIFKLIQESGMASIKTVNGKDLTPTDVDIIRAEMARKIFNS